MAAAVLRRRATAGIVATIRRRSTTPSDGSLRQLAPVPTIRHFASATTPRLPAASATTLRLSSAAPTSRIRPFAIAAPLRRIHQGAAATEALEAHIQRVEADLNQKIVALRGELQKGSAEACAKLEKGFADAHDALRKAHLDAYASFLQEQATQDVRISNLSELIIWESRRSLSRAATSSAENAKNLVQIGKVSWRVVITVVAGAASAGFATAQLLTAHTTTSQARVADERVTAMTAQLRDEFSTGLEETVQRALQAALSKENSTTRTATDEALQSFSTRLDHFFDNIDTRIGRAVELALAKQDKKVNPAGGNAADGPTNTS